METNDQAPAYGQGDTSFQSAGGQAGIQQLVERFYGLMAAHPRCERILHMHPDDIDVSIDKLSRFLCGWLGGPRRYQEKYGQIRLPMAHQHLSVSEQDKEDWLWCMMQAVADQQYAESFQTYLIEQLRRPAERIVVVCENSSAVPRETGNE
jgi:hemoglobin